MIYFRLYHVTSSHFFPFCCSQYESTSLNSHFCLQRCGNYDKTILNAAEKSPWVSIAVVTDSPDTADDHAGDCTLAGRLYWQELRTVHAEKRGRQQHGCDGFSRLLLIQQTSMAASHTRSRVATARKYYAIAWDLLAHLLHYCYKLLLGQRMTLRNQLITRRRKANFFMFPFMLKYPEHCCGLKLHKGQPQMKNDSYLYNDLC